MDLGSPPPPLDKAQTVPPKRKLKKKRRVAFSLSLLGLRRQNTRRYQKKIELIFLARRSLRREEIADYYTGKIGRQFQLCPVSHNLQQNKRVRASHVRLDWLETKTTISADTHFQLSPGNLHFFPISRRRRKDRHFGFIKCKMFALKKPVFTTAA